MSVGKSLAKGTVSTISSVFGIVGAAVGVVGDFAEGLVSETSKAVDGELMPREDNELLTSIKVLIEGMEQVKKTHDKLEVKIDAKLESIATTQSGLEKKIAELTARLEALEKSE